MSLNFSAHILWDYVYQQDSAGNYEFDSSTGDFKLRNKTEFVNSVLGILRQVYSNIITHYEVGFAEPQCNIVLLNQALMKYSRDIYGEKRLKARIDGNASHLPEAARENLSKFTDYGLKIDSTSPYIHREVSVLLYWLALLKPFSVDPSKEMMKKVGLLAHFHNEYISYILVQAALNLYDLKIMVHKNQHDFHDFLYDLHYRNLSRSSLEFFLYRYIEDIK